MIVVDIEFYSLVDTSREQMLEEIANNLLDNFPYNYVDSAHVIKMPVARDDGMHVLLQLAQSDLIAEQAHYLNKVEDLREYSTRRGGIEGNPLTTLQHQVVRDLLDRAPRMMVAHNEMSNKFFVQTGQDSHIVVTANRSGGYSQIQSVQYHEVTDLLLEEKELTDLLAALFQAKLEMEEWKAEDTAKVNETELPF